VIKTFYSTGSLGYFLFMLGVSTWWPPLASRQIGLRLFFAALENVVKLADGNGLPARQTFSCDPFMNNV